MQAYLASSSGSDDEEEDAEEAAARYRSLLLAGDDKRALGRQGGKGWGAEAGASGSDGSDEDEPEVSGHLDGRDKFTCHGADNGSIQRFQC